VLQAGVHRLRVPDGYPGPSIFSASSLAAIVTARSSVPRLSCRPAQPPGRDGIRLPSTLVLRARFATADLDAALAHAARFGALEHRAVERILEARCSPRTLDEYVAEATAQRLEQALGARRRAARDLTAYDRLPLARSPEFPAIAPPAAPAQEDCPCPSAPEHPAAPPPATTTSAASASAATSSSSA